MVQWVQCSLHKHGDLSSDAQKPYLKTNKQLGSGGAGL